MLTIFPFTVCTRVAQPTEQYGQTLGVAWAFSIRSAWAWARVGARLAPSPATPPRAEPVTVPADSLKKSRRDRSIGPPVEQDRLEPSHRRIRPAPPARWTRAPELAQVSASRIAGPRPSLQ